MGGDRRIGVAVDFSDCSRRALKWALDNIARSGDHLILISPSDLKCFMKAARCSSGKPPLIPLVQFSDPAIMKKYDVKPDPETLDIANTAARQKRGKRLKSLRQGRSHVQGLLGTAKKSSRNGFVRTRTTDSSSVENSTYQMS